MTDSTEAHFTIANEEINKTNESYHKKFEEEKTKLSEQSSKLTEAKEKLEKEIDSLQEQLDSTTDTSERERILNDIGEKSSEAQTKKDEINKLAKQMDALSIKIKEDYKPQFIQENKDRRRRDIQMDGRYSYERNCFIETIESPKNKKPKDILEAFNDEDFKYYVDLRINFRYRPIGKNGLLDDTYDFADVMNIGYEPFQNHPEKYLNINAEAGSRGKWMRKIEFENVWDRHSCKIYSSIAEESSRGYLGNSQIFYQPIKYFKLNSTDQRFWIEFYSGRFHKIPIKVPLNESLKL